MIIDFHTHCYPEKLAARALSALSAHARTPAYDGTLQGLKNAVKAGGIDKAVILHIANKPESTVQVNNWSILCGQEENVFSFGSVHPFYPDFKSEIARLKEAGIKGLKFHPYYQQYDVNDRAAYPLYEEAAKAGMIMLFHTGLDVLVPGSYGTSDKFARLVDDLKYEKIVGAHLGGSLTYQAASELIWGKNIYLDMSLSFRFLPAEYKTRLKDTHCADKLLFGSDGPWTGPEEDYKQINSFFNPAERELIYYKNAVNLLEI